MEALGTGLPVTHEINYCDSLFLEIKIMTFYFPCSKNTDLSGQIFIRF